MSDCIFCKIRDGEIPSTLVHENEHVIAFDDLNPAAPTHVLVIPRKHIATLDDLEPDDAPLVGELFLAARQVAADRGLAGYRAVMNCQAAAGQSVFHLHLHVLGGRPLTWPPG